MGINAAKKSSKERLEKYRWGLVPPSESSSKEESGYKWGKGGGVHKMRLEENQMQWI